MRRRLALLSLATTALVVIALLVPLGLLVKRQAFDQARIEAERQARTTAALVALALSFDAQPGTMAASVGPLADGVLVVVSDGERFGIDLPGQGTLVEGSMDLQATVTAVVPGGWEIALPVIGRDRVAVVDVFVTDQQIRAGVAEAWVLLSLLGVTLIAVAVWVADRMGRRLVAPVHDLAIAAHRLGEGDLSVRVVPGEPEELREVGAAFNKLASRLGQLLAAEREGVADMSHRLRTPITSLRLQSERISDPDERAEVISQIDRLESSVDALIVAARTRGSGVGSCRLDEVVSARAAFWKVLADEQGREMVLSVGAGDTEVGVGDDQVEDIVDALIDNVFTHTEPGTRFEISTGAGSHRAWIRVADEGPGLGDRSLIDRGVSGVGSTGLGLDIVRRSAELTGGGLEIGDHHQGGAEITVWFGEPPTRQE